MAGPKPRRALTDGQLNLAHRKWIPSERYEDLRIAVRSTCAVLGCAHVRLQFLAALSLLCCTCTSDENAPADAQLAKVNDLRTRIDNVRRLLAEQEVRALRAKREAEFYEMQSA